MQKISLPKSLFFLSIVMLLYFWYLAYDFFNPSIAITGFMETVMNIITVLLLILLLFSFVFSLMRIIHKDRKGYLMTFILNGVTILFIVYVTVLQMRG